GGRGDEVGAAIAVDASGNAYITGSTQSKDLPTTAGVVEPTWTTTAGNPGEAFVACISGDATKLIYATYLGGTQSGSAFDTGQAIVLDSSRNAYVVGSTSTKDFPVANPIQATSKGSGSGFICVLNPTGKQFLFSSYLGTTFTQNATDAVIGVALDSQNSI